MQMLKKIFSSDNKYYLEIKEEVQDSKVVQTAVETAEKTAEVVKEKVQEVANSEPVQTAAKKAGEAVEQVQEKAASAIATDETSQAKPAKVAKGKAKQNGEAEKTTKAKQDGKAAAPKAKQPEGEKKAQPTTKNSGASSFDPPFWVAAMNNTNKNSTNSNGQVAESTFAPDNLLPISTGYRRRPGGSLGKFKDMAKTAKTPKR